jgi:DNA polymerase
VDAYADGADLYVLTYAKTFNVDPASVTKDQRQIGKILELAMGYGGGAGAFATFAAGYGTDLEAMAEKALPILPSSILEEAEKAWDWTLEQGRPTRGLSQQVWIVCDSFKRQWRRANSEITAFWHDVEEAVREASDTGAACRARRAEVRRNGAWLRIVLPSGRSLSYPAPRVEDGTISFMGVNQFSRKWERLTTFGGRLVENITQATARDILACGLVNAEAAGLNPVLHVHDEIICEADDTPEMDAALLAACMSRNPDWADGLPLSAEGFECMRYRK